MEDISYEAVTKQDLKQLTALAFRHHDDFFQRNPHLRDDFYGSLVAICLCQGAASHYVFETVGVKDYDIWLFYAEPSSSTYRFPDRSRQRRPEATPHYNDRKVDILKRGIRSDRLHSKQMDVEQIIMNYLQQKNTKTKRMLLKQAVVGLWPESVFGKVFWKGIRNTREKP